MHYTGKTGTLDVRQRQCMVITFGAGGGRLALGLVRHPGAWRWSSYRATAGEEEPPDFLATDWILSQFHQDRARAEKEYRKFVKEGSGTDVWADLRGGVILGTERFVEALEPLLRGRSPEVTRPKLEELFSGIKDNSDRNERIYQAVPGTLSRKWRMHWGCTTRR